MRTALQLINQALDELLTEQEGEFDADTCWELAWFEPFGLHEGPFGQAETLSKAKNTSVAGQAEACLLTARAGKVRMLAREELPAGWGPATDPHLPVWRVTQQLIRALDHGGEDGAAAGRNHTAAAKLPRSDVDARWVQWYRRTRDDADRDGADADAIGEPYEYSDTCVPAGADSGRTAGAGGQAAAA